MSAYAEAPAILADRRFSSDRRKDNSPNPSGDPGFRERLRHQPPPMVGLDGAEHTAARRTVIGEFTAKRLAARRPRSRHVVEGFVDDMPASDARPVDRVQALSLPVPSLVICELIRRGQGCSVRVTAPLALHQAVWSSAPFVIDRAVPVGRKAYRLRRTDHLIINAWSRRCRSAPAR
ncbi:hypothetical protein [Streptomyces boncukensis]|uniref:Cytochrome P450 n=1 Tax=Streptomyces boncukensis TaxID=2711219 RepID=A0A6G4X6L0_9ACTN|nr:hypothetical protein [Streptomyces boncukensis]NGO72384.1 hypothetical protein [Streptomyces boncukensis]